MDLPHDCWNQLEHESAKAYHSFCIYRDLGPQRSIRKAYLQQLPPWRYTRRGRQRYSRLLPGCWVRWSRTHLWHQRAEAFDRHLGVRRISVPALRLFHEYLLQPPVSRKRSGVISLD